MALSINYHHDLKLVWLCTHIGNAIYAKIASKLTKYTDELKYGDKLEKKIKRELPAQQYSRPGCCDEPRSRLLPAGFRSTRGWSSDWMSTEDLRSGEDWRSTGDWRSTADSMLTGDWRSVGDWR